MEKVALSSPIASMRRSALPLAVAAILVISITGMIPIPAAASPPAGAPVQPAVARGFLPAGPMPSGSEVFAVIYVPLRNLDLLTSYAQSISTPGSTDYHRFLSQSQIAGLFYPTAQFDSVMATLSKDGMGVAFTAADSMIVVGGTVAQLHRYLGLNFERYANGSASYYSAGGTSAIPGVDVYSSNVTALFLGHPSTLVTSSTISSLDRSANVQNQTFAMESYPLTALQSVYNATSLYNRGFNGHGYNVGILDFYGDAQIAGQLAYFDSLTGLPAPPSFRVVPIGPYDPALGSVTGWDGEISLDVESAHAMAPGANITLYIANGALPIAASIAAIDQQGIVNDVSQSFSEPETFFSELGPAGYLFNIQLSDLFYELGSVGGITYMASTGDVGGSGFSSGPEGTPGYPSTSPFVTAVGGTTTYISDVGGVQKAVQTAWSNYGFVPYQVNYGGGTGGVSISEPKPWYQSGVASPQSYADGRMVPDISLNANVFPGVDVVFPGNVTGITGGTSEASPLLAGLVALLDQSNGSPMGLINPSLYTLGAGSAYGKALVPITFGYNIPWTEARGYNLVTGWGSVNMGYLSNSESQLSSSPGLSIVVHALNSTGSVPDYFLAGQQITVVAGINASGVPVTTGAFTATLQTLQGDVASAALSFDSSAGVWVGSITVPSSADGPTYVLVSGSSGGLSGDGMTTTFIGYILTISTPTATESNFFPQGFFAAGNLTTVDGGLAPPQSITLDAYSYSILTNQYTLAAEFTLTPFSGASGTFWGGQLQGNVPDGPVLLSCSGCFGYQTMSSGTGMQSMFILPPVVVEPGAVAPGQAITVSGFLQPPVNTEGVPSFSLGTSLAVAIELGSNVTALLVGPGGRTIASAPIYQTSSGEYSGELVVPAGTPPGLDTVLLESSYDSNALGTTVTGEFFGQVYVSGSQTTPSIRTSATYAYQGQTLSVKADISYANGTEAKFGMYSATVYPATLSNQYAALSNVQQIPLSYNSSLNLWVGSFTLPSTSSVGSETYLGSQGAYGGPYYIYASGVSPDGVPTTTAQSARTGFFVQPYDLIVGATLTSGFQTFSAAYQGDSFQGFDGTISSGFFLGTNTFSGSSTTLADVQVNGTLVAKDSTITLVNSGAVSIEATDSKVILLGSNVGSISLTGSQLDSINSKYASVSPAAPVVSISAPAANSNQTGSFTVSSSVTGADISSVQFMLNGNPVGSFTTNGTLSQSINSLSYPDGTYTLTVLATQSDGLSSSASIKLQFQNQLSSGIAGLRSTISSDVSTIDSTIAGVSSSVTSLGGTLTLDVGRLNSSITSLSSTLGSDVSSMQSSIATAGYLGYGAIAIAAVALVAAVFLARRGRG